MALQLYETDDTTRAATHAFPTTAAGSVSSAKAWHVWLDMGGTGATATDVRLILEAEITTSVWAETGTALVDRQEIQGRIVGSANPSKDIQFIPRGATDWTPLGSGSHLLLGTMRGGCSVYVEFRYAPSLDAGTGTLTTNWRLRLVSGQAARGRSDIGGICGVITGRGDPSRCDWIEAPIVAAIEPPEEEINISGRIYCSHGVDKTEIAESVLFDQTDGAAVTLSEVGTAYWALLSQPLAGGVVVVTKGLIGATGPPELPADSLLIATVLVGYEVGGISLIAASAVAAYCSNGRGLLTHAADSFAITVGRIRAALPAVIVDIASVTPMTLSPSATVLLYVGPTGMVLTEETYAPAGCLPLWSITTDGAGVTGVTDLRYGTRADTVEEV